MCWCFVCRFGHSQIADYIATMNYNFQMIEKEPIEETYHTPHMVLFEKGKALPGIGRWLAADPTPLADGCVCVIMKPRLCVIFTVCSGINYTSLMVHDP